MIFFNKNYVRFRERFLLALERKLQTVPVFLVYVPPQALLPVTGEFAVREGSYQESHAFLVHPTKADLFCTFLYLWLLALAVSHTFVNITVFFV
jgi:hypothetical protein